MSASESKTGRLLRTKKRSWWLGRIIGWTIIVLLLGVVGIEWYMRHTFLQTVASIQSSMKESERLHQGFSLSKASSLIKGSPKQGLNFKSSGKQVDLKWRSVFKTYKMVLDVGSDNKGRRKGVRNRFIDIVALIRYFFAHGTA